MTSLYLPLLNTFLFWGKSLFSMRFVLRILLISFICSYNSYKNHICIKFPLKTLLLPVADLATRALVSRKFSKHFIFWDKIMWSNQLRYLGYYLLLTSITSRKTLIFSHKLMLTILLIRSSSLFSLSLSKLLTFFREFISINSSQ